MRVDEIGFPKAIDIESFSNIAADIYRQDDPETIWKMREPLAALAQNSELLLGEMLRCHRQRSISNIVTEQPTYYVIHRTEGWSLRITVWMPESCVESVRVLENMAFAYDYPHDHNFDLLTVTCFGGGYETEVLTHEGIDSSAKVGDIVNAVSLGRMRLSPGTVFFYEACKDVHIQVPVESITMALNFLPFSPRNNIRPQYAFKVQDPHHLEILGSPLSHEQREMSLARFIGKFLDNGHDVSKALSDLRPC